MSENDSRAVLITGAAGGIGSATARTLAQRGYRVYAAVRGDRGRLESDPRIQVLPMDVTSPESIETAAKEVAGRQAGQGLHTVVNNAGVIVQGPLELVPPEELRRQFAVNVLGPAEVTRAFLPLLRQGKGRVIDISAPTARIATPYAGPISASKAALESLTDAMRLELAPWNIPVVTIVPGAIDTEIFAKAGTAGETALGEADPDRVELYRGGLDAVAASMATMKTSPPQTVADTIVRAVEATRPKRRYVAGSDARMMLLVIPRLPGRLRDRVLSSALGLRKAFSAPS